MPRPRRRQSDADSSIASLTNRLEAKAAMAKSGGEGGRLTVYDLLEKYKPQIAQALPRHMTADRLLRITATTIRLNPILLTCEAGSLVACILQIAQLGLEPGPLGHAYIVPFKDNKNGLTLAQLIIGYKGMIDLARRSGQLVSISAREIYENDFYKIRFGLQEECEHIPWYRRTDKTFSESGKIIGGYLVSHFRDGGHLLWDMSIEEIERHRAFSRAAESGPWKTHYLTMLRKTLVRAAWPWLPVSSEIMIAVERADEAVYSSPEEVLEGAPPLLPEAYSIPMPQAQAQAQPQVQEPAPEPQASMPSEQPAEQQAHPSARPTPQSQGLFGGQGQG